ncbi:MAG: ribosomal-protein-alanine N-acetyltransferase [Aureispira sp.]|jgi:ribosomal-protein-alanine N-acetyltransferase
MKASARLHFRDLTTKDTTALIQIYSEVEAMKFRANPPVLNTEDALNMIEQAVQEGLEFTSKRWAVVRKDNEQLIGTFVLSYNKQNYNKQNSTCTIGYSIGKKSWNKGYGKELLKAMIEAIKGTNCTLIKAFVHPQNLASISLLEKQHFYKLDANASKNLLTYCLNISL